MTSFMVKKTRHSKSDEDSNSRSTSRVSKNPIQMMGVG